VGTNINVFLCIRLSKTQKERDDINNKLKVSKPIVTCSHCGQSGGEGAMYRWHFDNCKMKGK